MFALAQSNTGKDSSFVPLYQEADKYYKKALLLHQEQKGQDSLEEQLNKMALQKFTLFLQSASAQSFAPDTLRFFAAAKAGELAHYFENFSQALTFYATAIREKQLLPALSDTLLLKPYMFSGLIYYNQNKFDSAVHFLKKAEAIQEKASGPLQETERLYNILGSIFYEYGNYRQAKNYFQKAADVLSPENPSYSDLLINYKINLATTLFKSEEYDAASAIYRSLLGKETYFQNHLYNNLGLIELSLGAPRQAIRYFKKVQYKNHFKIGLLNDIANAFFQLKEYDSARQYLLLALEENKVFNPANKSIDHGRSLKLFGDLQKSNANYFSALTYYRDAIRQFYPAYHDTALLANPVVFTGAFSYINLFHALVAKAETLQALYRQTNNLQWAIEEVKTYQTAFRLIEYVEKTYDSDEARLFLTKIKYAVHHQPVESAFELYQKTNDVQYLEALYAFDQQNKATTLLLSRQISQPGTLNDTGLLSKERQLKSNISRLTIKASQLKDSAGLVALNAEIRDQEILLGKLQERLNQQAGLQETAIVSTKSLQTTVLDKATAILSYHLGKTKLTTLVLSKRKLDCFQKSLPSNFTNDLNQFIQNLKDPSSGAAVTDGAKYYQLLFGELPLQGIKKLILVPDDILNYLPFESLPNSRGHYLVQDYAIQYQYSTALIKKEQNDFSGFPALSFAPFTASSAKGNFQQLPNSRKEIEGVVGIQLLDTAATKSRFLQQCASYKILHLATHAVVNNQKDDLSYIAFSPVEEDHLLYAQEIYNLPLQQTKLVLLSACETSGGQFIKGEGVMSLSRAFRYAGCPNIITTLWKADDFSTAYLTTRIHQYLEKDFSIADAVQVAKKDYLEDKTVHPRLKHPFYWSHLVFIGDVQDVSKNTSKWYFNAFLGLMLLLLFLLWKKSRKAGQ